MIYFAAYNAQKHDKLTGKETGEGENTIQLQKWLKSFQNILLEHKFTAYEASKHDNHTKKVSVIPYDTD